MPEDVPATNLGAEAEIRAAIDRYRRSIDNADTDLAATVWATTEDVSFIHPRGHERGWTAIRTGFYEHTMGVPFSDRRLNISQLSVHVGHDAVWAEFYWVFKAKFRTDRTTLVTEGRESQIYHRRDGEWRLVHVHYSGMPVTGEREGFLHPSRGGFQIFCSVRSPTTP